MNKIEQLIQIHKASKDLRLHKPQRIEKSIKKKTSNEIISNFKNINKSKKSNFNSLLKPVPKMPKYFLVYRIALGHKQISVSYETNYKRNFLKETA
jgi:hypothetical protein